MGLCAQRRMRKNRRRHGGRQQEVSGVYRVDAQIPARAGIGLRTPHYREILESRPAAAGWLEVHSENYFGAGGQPHTFLEQLRAHYPLSLHGVGLGLGSVDALDQAHLRRLECLIARYEPGLVSEHLCWSAAGGRHLNDLLPLPYTEEALDHVAERVLQTQDSSSDRFWSRTFPAICAFVTPRCPSGTSSQSSRGARDAASCST